VEPVENDLVYRPAFLAVCIPLDPSDFIYHFHRKWILLQCSVFSQAQRPRLVAFLEGFDSREGRTERFQPQSNKREI